MEVEILFRDDPGHVGFGEAVGDEKGFVVRLSEFGDDLICDLRVEHVCIFERRGAPVDPHIVGGVLGPWRLGSFSGACGEVLIPGCLVVGASAVIDLAAAFGDVAVVAKVLGEGDGIGQMGAKFFHVAVDAGPCGGDAGHQADA